jgi:DNA end-binding protein Ku
MASLWSGHINFGLVSIPVGLFSALEASERVSFHLFHRKDMAPIRYKKFCSKEDVEVSGDEIVKAFEVEKKQFVKVEKAEMDHVEEEIGGAGRTIDVLQFVELTSLNPLSFDQPYFVAPMKGGERAYDVLRGALLDARRVGIARVTMRTRPVLAALIPDKKFLALEVLRPFEELRDPAELSIPVISKRPAEVKMAKLLIDQMSTEEWDPTAHPDEYKKALKKLLAGKRRFGVVRADAAGTTDNVIDLMAALKKSVARASGHPKAKAHASRAGAA